MMPKETPTLMADPLCGIGEALGPPVGSTKQTNEDDSAPGPVRTAAPSDADTVSTASYSGDDSSEHEVATHPDWKSSKARYANWQRVTVPLSEYLQGLLSSRRGKERLRHLQNQSGVDAELDLTWPVLHLCGPRQALVDAGKLLELMEGFIVKLPTTLWTELLRCRNLSVQEAPLSMKGIEAILGRRVHVERESLALRVFAPLRERAATTQAVQALASLCTRQFVDLPATCDWNIIKQLETSDRVTMKFEGSRVELTGHVDAVQLAAQDLRAWLQPHVPETLHAGPMFVDCSWVKVAQPTQELRPPPGLEHPYDQQSLWH